VYSISKDFNFSASHQLNGLPEGHQCGRLHGHNYAVRLILSSDVLDDHGFVVDYGDLGWFKEWIDGHFDHKHLNDVVGFNPTAENLAHYLYVIVADWLDSEDFDHVKLMVSVSETPKTWANYAEVER
jgi:6-pyruvoyltetrahydropterin/6-carboxytetrahydropterin synthase